MNDARLKLALTDPVTARVLRLTLRARRAGYRMVWESQPPYRWKLLDAGDGACLHTAQTLEQLERWLDE